MVAFDESVAEVAVLLREIEVAHLAGESPGRLQDSSPTRKGSKPRDADVEGWWPDNEGAPRTYSEDAVPDDAEEGILEMSDPWFLETEAGR